MTPAQNSLTSFNGQSPVTSMSSREIAELVGSPHDSVLKTVRRLRSEGVVSGNDTPYTHTQNGQIYTEIRLSFRDTMVVASGYSAELRARIVDRWMELEQANQPAPQRLLPTTLARHTIDDDLAVAQLLGVPLHLAQSEAVKHARLLTGVDYGHLLAHAPAQNDIQYEQVMLEPTELGRVFGLSAVKMNQKLEQLGLQARESGQWVPTESAKGAWARHQWVSGGKSGYNLKWNKAFVEKRMKAA